MRQDYDTEAQKLARAIDIAIEAITKYPPKDHTEDITTHFVKIYSEWKYSILNPEPKFKKIASLKYQIQDVFTYFQEGSGEAVEYFWKQLSENKLGYAREDKLRKIIDRGKIKGRIEYDLVLDNLVVAEQEKRITQDEAKLLRKMIGEFESRLK